MTKIDERIAGFGLSSFGLVIDSSLGFRHSGFQDASQSGVRARRCRAPIGPPSATVDSPRLSAVRWPGMRESYRRLLLDLLALPTSPFHEHAIIEYVRRWAAQRPRIKLTSDAYGNLRLDLRIGKARTGRPLFFSAHMDHPGFVALRMLSDRELEAKWHGGVQPEFFQNARVRFHDGKRWIRGKVKSYEVADVMGRQRVSTAVVEVRRPVPAEAVGMWDLPDPVIRGSRIHARGCDDVAGVAAVLAALDDLQASGKPVCTGALLTRAEEVGFAGCDRRLPERMVAEEGPSCCRSSAVLFNRAWRWAPGRSFVSVIACRYSRRRWSRGAGRWPTASPDRTAISPTSESSSTAGRASRPRTWSTGTRRPGLSLPLGNYHNMNHQTGRIAAEYVDVNDFERMVMWFTALATSEETRKPNGFFTSSDVPARTPDLGADAQRHSRSGSALNPCRKSVFSKSLWQNR